MGHSDTIVKWLIFGSVFIIILTAVGMLLNLKNDATVRIDNKLLSVQVADTPHEHAKGLSDTEPLQDDEGMLFIYEAANQASIWMKDMNYSLDIIWLDDDKKIIEIVENATPESYPKVFRPAQPARYVIEIPAGYIKEHNITRSSIVTFSLPQ